MKLAAINNVRQQNNYNLRAYSSKAQNNQTYKTSTNNVNFTGGSGSFIKTILDLFVKFWKFIDKAGRMAQFTAEDMLGTNFPRSIKGLMAGKKFTGHYNWLAFAQEAIREFMTGPTMTFVPIAIWAIANKKLGASSATHIENLDSASYLMKNIESNKSDVVKQNFFNTATKDLLSSTLNKTGKDGINCNQKVTNEDIDNITNALFEYSNNILKTAKTKEDKKQLSATVAESKSAILKLYESILKSKFDDYKDIDFESVKYSISPNLKGSTSFSDYVDYVVKYANDFVKENTTKDGITNISDDIIDKFKDTWTGKRTVVVMLMIFLTGFLMKQIPALYTKASGHVNPNASAVYDEADKQNGNRKENK